MEIDLVSVLDDLVPLFIKVHQHESTCQGKTGSGCVIAIFHNVENNLNMMFLVQRSIISHIYLSQEHVRSLWKEEETRHTASKYHTTP